MGNAAGPRHAGGTPDPGGNGAVSTFGSLERTLDRTIDCLVNGEQTREARALLIEARRLRSVIANWRSIPPPKDVHEEMLDRVLSLSTSVGVVVLPDAPDVLVREDPQIAVGAGDAGGVPDDDADTYSLDFEPHLYSLSADTSARRLAIPPPAQPAQAMSPARAYAAVELEPERMRPPSLPPAWLPVHDAPPATTPRDKPAPAARPRDGGSPPRPAEEVRRDAPSPAPAASPPAPAQPSSAPPPATRVTLSSAPPPPAARVITRSSVPPPPAPRVITRSSVPPPRAPPPSPAPPALRSAPPPAPDEAALTELPSADPGDDELGAPRTLVTAQAVKLAEPIDPLLLFLTQPYSPRADAYRALRRKFTSTNPARVIAITSANAGEGKTVFALNFALTLREVARGPVLVVEVNHRAPGMAKLLGIPPTPCFIGQLQSHVEDPRAPWIAAEPLAKLHVMAVDPERKHPPLLDTVAFSNGMERLKQAGYEYIIVDSPCVHSGMDCNIIADSVDGLIFTAIPMKSMRKQMRKAVEQLEPAPIFGVVCLEA